MSTGAIIGIVIAVIVVVAVVVVASAEMRRSRLRRQFGPEYDRLVEKHGSKKKADAWKFISWAAGKQYENLVGQQVGWSSVPAGKRASTYQNPDYLAQAKAFAAPTEAAINSADPRDPGVQPRPAIGIQFVDIPEFTDLGTQVSQYVSSAIAGQMTVNQALKRGQRLAQDVAERYQSRQQG